MSRLRLAPTCPLCHVEHVVGAGAGAVVERAHGERLGDYWQRVQRAALASGYDRDHLRTLVAALPVGEADESITFACVPAPRAAWFIHEVSILTGRQVVLTRSANQQEAP